MTAAFASAGDLAAKTVSFDQIATGAYQPVDEVRRV